MNIAIIGSGIAGLSTAWALTRGGHQVRVFEKSDRIGGHTNTIDQTVNGIVYPVDTGFIVYNHQTYHNFYRLLAHLGVQGRDTEMSFSVRDDATGIEYNGHTSSSLFAQRRNLFRPSHWSMIRDILRFNKQCRQDVATCGQQTLALYLRNGSYGQPFINRYLVPMGAAIWSMAARDVLAMPLRFFVQFFHNHGFLEVDKRPIWRTVVGGSHAYIAPLIADFKQNIVTNCTISSVTRHASLVTVHTDQGPFQADEVVFACHSDQALALLGDASKAEQSVLGRIGYTTNQAYLHTDASVMPRSSACRAAWNYHRIIGGDDQPVPVTYDMNLLQGFATCPQRFFVTLNRGDHIQPSSIIKNITYAHPAFTPQAVQAQSEWKAINGVNRTWFAGAYWRYGFHEDGLLSGLRVAQHLGCATPWASEVESPHEAMAVWQ